MGIEEKRARPYAVDAAFVRRAEGHKIIDVRTEAEFRGAETFGAARGGHIPGAINIPVASFVNADGSMREAGAVLSLLQEHGIAQDDRLIVYCTVGARSGVAAAVLAALGYAFVGDYQEGFSGWAADPANPVS